MSRRGRHNRPYLPSLVAHSPLRGVDPRAKLVLSSMASLAVMLPLERLVLFMGLYVALLLVARLLPLAARQLWRLRWLLVALFVMDWLFVGLDLAVIVSLRVILLAGVFTLFVSTTTPTEFRHALERLGVPDRYAFSLGLAFQSVNILREEWRAIREAQRARGLSLAERVRLPDLVALTVPAIVLATRRAWAMTEAAYARGFEAPHRRPYRRLRMRWYDWGIVVGAVGVIVVLVVG